MKLPTSLFIWTLVITAVAIGSWMLATRDSNLLPASNKDTITIVTTIFPLTDIAENIGGNRINIVQLLPPGASPHSYTITPQQLADIQNASVLLNIGHDLDSWAVEQATKTANIPVVQVDKNIELQEFALDSTHEDEHEEENDHNHRHEEGSIDPHYWLTIPNAQKIAKTITATLQDIDPEHSEEYESNLQDYLAKLNETEMELQKMAQQAEQTKFIAIHDAWSYFAQHYGLELIATYEPVEGREPSIQDIQELQEIIREHNITTFFTEPQKQSTSATRFLENDFGLNIKTIDPIGNGSYIKTMLQNMRTLTQ